MSYVIQVIPTYGPSAGGVGTVIQNLSSELNARKNDQVEILDMGAKQKYDDAIPINSIRGGPLVSLAGIFLFLLRRKPNITHLHGIWHPLSAPCALARLLGRHKHICSPHGMLTSWILSKGIWKKRLARLLYEELHWRSLDCFHALTRTEAEEIARIVPPNKRIAIIPNGVAVAEQPFSYERSQDENPYILYLGRFHEKKGLVFLLEAWRSVSLRFPAARLKIVGWGDLEILKEADLPPGLEILPPAYDEEKSDLIRNARFLILPSFSEGLPMVILEAWALGTPVIMTDGCNLPEGFENNSSIRIEPNIESTRAGLEKGLCISLEERNAMGENGHRLCREKYSIQNCAKKFQQLYEFIVSNKPCPDVEFFTT